jgi:hypothetical protein
MKFLLDHDVPDEVGQLLRICAAGAAHHHQLQSEPLSQPGAGGCLKGSSLCGLDYSNTPANTAVGVRSPVIVAAPRGRIRRERECQPGLISPAFAVSAPELATLTLAGVAALSLMHRKRA